MELSRYLYEKGEVRASFINSLLKRKKSESLFWISEYFLSGWHEETVDLLWEVYYDFYYIYHSKMEKKIYNILKEVNLKNILTVATSLYYLKEKTTHTFELRLIIQNTNIPSVDYIYKQIPEDYNVYKNKHFIYSIKKQHIINISYYFQQANNNSPTITISDIYSDVKKLLGVDSFIHNNNKNIQQHMIIALISKYALLDETTTTIRTRNALFHIESSLLKMLMNEETDVAKQHPYCVLANQRKFEIDNDIGLDHFSLSRFQDTPKDKHYENSVRYNIYYHWEYYAFNTPLWMKRFALYKGYQNHMTKSVEFPTEELAEKFYEKYAYEPDEQSYETDVKSTKNIEEIQYDVWRSRVFSTHIF